MAIAQDLLRRVILDQHQSLDWPEVYIHRTIEDRISELMACKEIIVLRGLRRAGKSVLMERIRRLQPGSNDYYFNFEDERLVNFAVEDFELLHQTLISLYGEQQTFYLDEIQNIPNWELFVRRMYNAGFKIFLTGSNANLFSEELGTRLTGRYIALNVYPISFKEYSNALFPIDKNKLDTVAIGKIQELYSRYLELGGIPAYIQNQHIEYLHSLYESILYRDIISRYNISNVPAFKKLLFYLASNCGKLMSFNKLLGMINSNSMILKSSTTVSEYCEYLSNSYLCLFVQKYDENLKSQLQAPRKAYMIDHALAKIIGFRSSEDRGHLLENIVFLELKRRGYEVYYYERERGCDFVVRDNFQTLDLIQVTQNMQDPETRKREIAGLVDAMQYFNKNSGTIITNNESGTEEIEQAGQKYTIIIHPAWYWLKF